MMAEFIRFMIFSMLEVMGAISIALALFRFRLRDYILPALAVDFLMALQSFTLRDELSMGIVAPLVNILLLTFFVFAAVRIPLMWSFVVSLTGYVVSVLFQALTIILSDGYFAPSNLQLYEVRGYILQSWTAVALLVIAYILYKFGIGLSFQFEKFRFKAEKVMVIGLYVIMMGSFSIMFYYRTIYFDIVILLLALIFFAYYLLRKETEGNDSAHSPSSCH